jgi:hypothetical protein
MATSPTKEIKANIYFLDGHKESIEFENFDDYFHYLSYWRTYIRTVR